MPSICSLVLVPAEYKAEIIISASPITLCQTMHYQNNLLQVLHCSSSIPLKVNDSNIVEKQHNISTPFDMFTFMFQEPVHTVLNLSQIQLTKVAD